MTYKDKLLDPRWQKKRLEIFNRDRFICKLCFSSDETLHVHHQEYSFGKEPWEYDDSCLITLCSSCHTDLTAAQKRFDSCIKKIRKSNPYPLFLNELCDFLEDDEKCLLLSPLKKISQKSIEDFIRDQFQIIRQTYSECQG